MKTKTLIVGSVLVAVGVGAYFFLVKNKNTGAGLIPNGLASVGTGATTGGGTSTSGTQSQTEAPPPATIDEISINQNKIIEQNKYQQVLNIQQKYVNNMNNKCAGLDRRNTSGNLFQKSPYDECINIESLQAYVSINKEINPLGYKLSKYAPLSEIVKLTL